MESVSYSFTPPSSDANWNTSWRFSDQAEIAPYPVNMKPADTAYVRTYGLQLVAGRMYQPGDTAREYVVNETFVRKAGLKNAQAALGKLIVLGRRGDWLRVVVSEIEVNVTGWVRWHYDGVRYVVASTQ